MLEIELPPKYFQGLILSQRFMTVTVIYNGQTTDIQICQLKNNKKWYLKYKQSMIKPVKLFDKPEDALFTLNWEFNKWVRNNTDMAFFDKLKATFIPPVKEWHTINLMEGVQ